MTINNHALKNQKITSGVEEVERRWEVVIDTKTVQLIGENCLLKKVQNYLISHSFGVWPQRNKSSGPNKYIDTNMCCSMSARVRVNKTSVSTQVKVQMNCGACMQWLSAESLKVVMRGG